MKPDRGRGLPQFEQITTENGLRSNNILHIIQLKDGRIAITTDSCVNIYDAGQIRQYPLPVNLMRELPHYQGYCNVFYDNDQLLWVKDWGMVWCLNLRSGKCEDLSSKQMDDVFIDSQHRIFTLSDSIISTDYHFQHEWGEFQDLEADLQHLYLFFSTGTVACYNLHTCEMEYNSKPYDLAEAAFYDKSSILRRSPDGLFYQLRCGAQRNIFLCFNPDTRQWRTVFETKKGLFHTLCIVSPELALLSCSDGLWKVHLQTGEMELHSAAVTIQGDTVRSELNTVFCDNEGGLWLGTCQDGVLYSPTVYSKPSYLIYYIVGSFIALILVIVLSFYWYASRERRRGRALIHRLQQLLEQASQPQTEEEEISAPMEKPNELVTRAIALVEKNLSVPGYNVEQLASDLCMERTGLYRKLTTLLDQSPTTFIRNIRMERAASLLRETQLPVQEISQKCGFATSSYFSRLFQQVYGKKPSEYREENV